MTKQKAGSSGNHGIDYEAAEQAVSEIKRQQTEVTSRQDQNSKFTNFGAFYKWGKQAMMESPPYKSNTRKRDKWLSAFWPQEPHLAGVLKSVVDIDKNRGWSIIGGRNQVARYQSILRNAEGGDGWRRYAALQSLSYYTADIGAVTEIARAGDDETNVAPLRGIWHVDPTRVSMTGDGDYPLKYYPQNGAAQDWSRNWFYRTVSMPSILEEMNGAGFCAVSRAVELAQIMYSVYQYDKEELGAQAPKGLLLLQNISEEAWIEAMEARQVKLQGMEREYFGGVAVLASDGIDQADAKLVALSKLPQGFSQKDFVNLLMYGYALIFGFDAAEFWPAVGGLNSGSEVAIQHQKATGKGALSFVLDLQDQMQLPGRLPPSLTFEFDQRDAAGDLLDAGIAQAHANISKTLYEAGLSTGQPLLSREEARSLLAEAGVIPREWTEMDEEYEVTDVNTPTDDLDGELVEMDDTTTRKTLRAQYRGNMRVARACEMFHDEPIVRYNFPTGKVDTIWNTGSEALRRAVWPVDEQLVNLLKPLNVKSRQRTGEVSRAVLYENEVTDVIITDEDVDLALEQAGERVSAEFEEVLNAQAATPEDIAEFGLEDEELGAV